jgi:hypothetical protein
VTIVNVNEQSSNIGDQVQLTEPDILTAIAFDSKNQLQLIESTCTGDNDSGLNSNNMIGA